MSLTDFIPGQIVPLLATIALVTLLLSVSHHFLLRRPNAKGAEKLLPRQLFMLLLSLGSLLLIILSFPMSDGTRAQVLSLFGIVFTGLIAFSSTTFVANAMAGLMLRVVKTFRPGDFVRVGDKFGKVTERGLFHTEIQTEDRDLTTFPNLFLVTSPVTVVMKSGTIISATVSLGYDQKISDVERCLIAAANETGLTDAFVQVIDLGDFSIVYRVAGFLDEVNQLLTRRSNLRRAMVNTLHRAGIEIVSPNFMNQRQLSADKRVMPARHHPPQPVAAAEAQNLPEARIFDVASLAEQIEQLDAKGSALRKSLASGEFDGEGAEAEKAKLESQIGEIDKEKEALKRLKNDHARGEPEDPAPPQA